MTEYSHVVIDKTGVGLDVLRRSINENGLQTAEQRGIVLSQGSMRLQHHQHIFLWDTTAKGLTGRQHVESAGNCFTVKVRWDALSESGIVFSGNLKGDSMQNQPPSGASTNGAWAYKGSIPRIYCYIEGPDIPATANFDRWMQGLGWTAP